MTTTDHIKHLIRVWHFKCPDDPTYRPNWMWLEFKEKLRPDKFVVTIDHKNPEARRALGALIQHLWISCETWEIVTSRPKY